jgi:hypothetical protein
MRIRISARGSRLFRNLADSVSGMPCPMLTRFFPYHLDIQLADCVEFSIEWIYHMAPYLRSFVVRGGNGAPAPFRVLNFKWFTNLELLRLELNRDGHKGDNFEYVLGLSELPSLAEFSMCPLRVAGGINGLPLSMTKLKCSVGHLRANHPLPNLTELDISPTFGSTAWMYDTYKQLVGVCLPALRVLSCDGLALVTSDRTLALFQSLTSLTIREAPVHRVCRLAVLTNLQSLALEIGKPDRLVGVENPFETFVPLAGLPKLQLLDLHKVFIGLFGTNECQLVQETVRKLLPAGCVVKWLTVHNRLYQLPYPLHTGAQLTPLQQLLSHLPSYDYAEADDADDSDVEDDGDDTATGVREL